MIELCMLFYKHCCVMKCSIFLSVTMMFWWKQILFETKSSLRKVLGWQVIGLTCCAESSFSGNQDNIYRYVWWFSRSLKGTLHVKYMRTQVLEKTNLFGVYSVLYKQLSPQFVYIFYLSSNMTCPSYYSNILPGLIFRLNIK